MLIKLVVFGSRGFVDYDLLKNTCNDVIRGFDPEDVLIISGGARGADRLTERWSSECELDNIIMRPKWSIYGKRAGYKRNTRMGDFCTHGVGFWDGQSPGTQHMMRYMKTLKKPLMMVDSNTGEVKTFNWGTEGDDSYESQDYND